MDRDGIRHSPEGNDSVAMRMVSCRQLVRTWRCAILAVSGTIAALAMSACDSNGRVPPVDKFTVEAEIQPVWRTPAVSEPIPENSIGEDDPKALVVYLDLSRPMAGFLPLRISTEGSPRATNEFRAVAQWVPDHLTRVYPTATLHWRGVGRDIQDLSQYPQFARTLFHATASRLDLAIQEVLSNLRSGRSEAAALITDLLGTGELTGALAVSRYLSDWLDSESVRSGEFHLGLLGVKTNYWGATTLACPPKSGLGCWYSERGSGWRRLEDVVTAPFYVLLIGRNAQALSTILSSIQSDADKLGIDAVSELLTISTRRRNARMTCEVFTSDGQERSQQYALRRDEDGYYSCVRADRVSLSCDFGGGFRPTKVRLAEFRGEEPEDFESRIEHDAGLLEIEVDCRSLGEPPTPDLVLEVIGTVASDVEPPPWHEWSIETDDFPVFPGKTIQLNYFIEEVRLVPDSYRAELPPLLRGRKQ